MVSPSDYMKDFLYQYDVLLCGESSSVLCISVISFPYSGWATSHCYLDSEDARDSSPVAQPDSVA